MYSHPHIHVFIDCLHTVLHLPHVFHSICKLFKSYVGHFTTAKKNFQGETFEDEFDTQSLCFATNCIRGHKEKLIFSTNLFS